MHVVKLRWRSLTPYPIQCKKVTLPFEHCNQDSTMLTKTDSASYRMSFQTRSGRHWKAAPNIQTGKKQRFTKSATRRNFWLNSRKPIRPLRIDLIKTEGRCWKSKPHYV